ncbi:hypothetical protein E2562_014638 [Oryza meyeriana var. granulata]|uniref:Uncharacterized protein n=1 Tax=Oryza meyeriana var. granulata TaxID=110450 RepID=A0A6G1D3T7_9ORYZ|nr:hypothetical protein E2562_014638 [Oryza meyeriana var. granulata]
MDEVSDHVRKVEIEKSEYLPGDDESSEDDEEAAEKKAKFKEFKKKFTTGEYVAHVIEGNKNILQRDFDELVIGDDGDSETSNFTESEEEDSYDDEGSDGELQRKKPRFPRGL